MIDLLLQGQVAMFGLILIAIVISLSFHEFGHAITAKFYGDDTAERAGRLTLNPLAHIDPMGLLLVAIVGFGYAKPVPTNPAKFTSRYADLFVSAAGPGMNLLIAIVTINFFAIGQQAGWTSMENEGVQFFFYYLALINMILMIFNLLPIGALDGHYILPYFLPRQTAQAYRNWNHLYGNRLLLGLMLLSLLGLPVFSYIFSFGQALLPLILFF